MASWHTARAYAFNSGAAAMVISNGRKARTRPHVAATIVIPEDGNAPALRIPATAFTQRGFRKWATSDDFPETGRISYLNGEIWIDMGPETIETHSLIKSEVGFKIIWLNRKEKRGLFMGDGVLLTNEAAGLSTEQDAVFVLWSTLESGRLQLVPRKKRRDLSKEVRGTPDWVLEVVSDSSVVKNTRKLRELYSNAGIPEYWLIDARGTKLAFTILVLGKDGYSESRRGPWQVSPLFGRRFRLDRSRGPMDLWQYTLHHRRNK